MVSTIKNGKSFEFYGHRYNNSSAFLRINDKVLIDNKYKAEVVTHHVPSVRPGPHVEFETTRKLCLRGIEENKHWEGKVIDKFEFNRLTFVSR